MQQESNPTLDSSAKSKVGVVVGRFQVDNLTIGHRLVLDTAKENSDLLVILIGSSVTRNTINNPLTRHIVYMMLMDSYPEAIIGGLEDCPSNEIWSESLDKMVEGYGDITLYGGRDSFAKFYKGKFPVHICPDVGGSATEIRDKIGKGETVPTNPVDFRRGMIFSAYNKYPVCYPTVDAIIYHPESYSIVLGKREGVDLFQFPGGFYEESDRDIKSCLYREVQEETGLKRSQLGGAIWIAGLTVNDYRYKGSGDSVLTSLFIVSCHERYDLSADDDLFSVEWKRISEITEDSFIRAHIPLWRIFEQREKENARRILKEIRDVGPK